ncbi:MAG TPA: alpha/beta fold hydrolase, partial [Pyrinomonadaceae bacterium]|nr:alpha/beta fold hydrolase [Pyrinomonadaceae bacterium]
NVAPKTGIAEVNGTKLYFEISGNGHPLILINGSSLDLRMWDEQEADFAARFRVIRYDLRGLGKSATPDVEFSHSRDLFHLLKHLNIEKAYILGLSFGGAIAIDFALENPAMTDALIVASSALSSLKNDYLEGLDALSVIADKSGAASAIDELMSNPSFVAPENAAARQKTREILLDNAHIFETRFPLIRFWQPPQFSLDENICRINAPTLIIVGDRDAPVINDIADNLSKSINGAKKVVIKNAGHMINLEKPAEFNRAVTDFLQTIL